MTRAKSGSALWCALICVGALGCSAEVGDGEDLGSLSQALEGNPPNGVYTIESQGMMPGCVRVDEGTARNPQSSYTRSRWR